jgi:SAM-dependent methyltransferase
MDRPWLNDIDLKKRILEIGPLAWPNIKKEQAENVFYADIRSTDDVKRHYKDDKNVPQDKIVEIDYVITGGYYSCLKDVDKFDYIIATHVIEHIPDLILFFQDISNILNPQGKICLSIPDKRYCFDHFRMPTSFAECYDIYIRGIKNSPLKVLDYYATTTLNDCTYWWKETNNFDHLPKSKNKFYMAKDNYLRALNGKYLDVHFSVFTPETFLLLLYYMVCYNLFSFKCVEFYKTEMGTSEFNCVLEFEPNILIEDSIANKKEKENIISLLIENSDSVCSMVIFENLKNELQKSNNDLERTKNDLHKSNNDLERTKNDLQKSNNDLERTKNDLHKLNNDLERTKNDLHAVLFSKSWKITAPLRKIKAVCNKFVR